MIILFVQEYFMWLNLPYTLTLAEPLSGLLQELSRTNCKSTRCGTVPGFDCTGFKRALQFFSLHRAWVRGPKRSNWCCRSGDDATGRLT